MSIQEKWAWFVVGVTALTFVLHGAAVAAYGLQEWTFAAYGLLGLTGFTRLIGRKELGFFSFGARSLVGRKNAQGVTVFDERDGEIAQRAYRIGFAAFFLVFVLGAFAARFWPGFGTSGAPIPLLIWCFPAGCFVMLVRHATILILYRVA